jgi:hypothetical protein
VHRWFRRRASTGGDKDSIPQNSNEKVFKVTLGSGRDRRRLLNSLADHLARIKPPSAAEQAGT